MRAWKRYSVVVAALVCVCNLFIAVPDLHVRAEVKEHVKFDDTNVMDDLRSATTFNAVNYPYYDRPEMYIINFVEYCYSYRVNMQSNYGLYLYVYNPSGVDLDTAHAGNKVQIAVAYGAAGTPQAGLPVDYEKFSLKFCNKSEEPNYRNLFYKFKVIDRVSETDGKTILERVNSNARRYDVSGIELVTDGSQTATEYLVGGTFTFTGFADGYGPAGGTQLSSTVNDLETVKLDVYSTYYRTGASATGKDYQNNLNSVYFAVPDDILDKYGKLQKIKAEWWEYKTAPIIITNNTDFYNGFDPYVGYVLSGERDSSVPYELGTDYKQESIGFGEGSTTQISYAWSYNVRQSDTPPVYVFSGYVENQLPYLLKPDSSYSGGVLDYVLPGEKLRKYIYDYNRSHVRGYLPVKNGRVSADLFQPQVDAGRTMGYNLKEIDSDDKFDMLSYDSNHSWWDKFLDYGFWAPETGGDLTDVSPIVKVEDADISGTNAQVAARLLINESDVAAFQKFYAESVLTKKTPHLFRFAATDYYSAALRIAQGAKVINNAAYMAQETVFLDFDIIQLTFNKDGVYHVIPVVASPIDIVNDITPPLKDKNWWKILLMVLLLVLLLVLLAPLLPYVLRFVWWLIMLPFRFIGWLAKAIKTAARKE